MSWTEDELRLARRMRAAGYTYKEIGLRIGKKEKTVAGYVIDQANRSQTVVVNTNDTQNLYFYKRGII